jgi:hypothetical protein
MSEFLCLMNSGVPFSEELRDFLVDTARYMKRNKIERQRFKSESYEGEIRSKFTPYFISSGLSGVLFSAELECEEGKTTVRYLMTTKDLKKKADVKWSPWYKVEATHPRDNASNN